MAFPKRPYSLEDIAAMSKELQRYKELMVLPPCEKLKGTAKRSQGRRDYPDFIHFANQPPEVRARAQERLNYLLVKHHAKLEEKGVSKYYGVLCAAAVAMAKRDLGLVIGYKELFKKYRNRLRRHSALRTMLGLQEHKSWDMSHRPLKGEAKPKLQVTYTSLEGI